MTFEQLLNKVCMRGRASAQATGKGHKLKGALRGFDIAASADDSLHLVQLLTAEREADATIMHDYEVGNAEIEDYWEQRYCTLQVEYVLEVVNVGVQLKDTVSARAVMAYADIVGTKNP